MDHARLLLPGGRTSLLSKESRQSLDEPHRLSLDDSDTLCAASSDELGTTLDEDHTGIQVEKPAIELPLELCELIMDNVIDSLSLSPFSDRDHLRTAYCTLTSCAITCHNWLPRARRNLYSHLYLTSDDACTSLIRALHSNTFLADLVESLTLDIDTTHPPYEENSELTTNFSSRRAGLHDWSTFPQRLSAISLPNLATLCIALPFDFNAGYPQNLIPFGADTPSNFISAWWRFPSIKKLYLDGVSFYSFDYFFEVVCSLPSLEDLNLSNCTLETTDLPTIAPWEHPPIRRLSFRGNPRRARNHDPNVQVLFRNVLYWVIAPPEPVMLEELDLKFVEHETQSVALINMILKESGHNLRRLVYDREHSPSQRWSGGSLDLQHSNKLQVLTLSNITIDEILTTLATLPQKAESPLSDVTLKIVHDVPDTVLPPSSIAGGSFSLPTEWTTLAQRLIHTIPLATLSSLTIKVGLGINKARNPRLSMMSSSSRGSLSSMLSRRNTTTGGMTKAAEDYARVKGIEKALREVFEKAGVVREVGEEKFGLEVYAKK